MPNDDNRPLKNDALSQFGVTLRFGFVVEVQAKPPRYKVQIPDADDMVTDWLLCNVTRSKGDMTHHGLEVGEQVSLLLDVRGETGVILGAVYSTVDQAPDGTWVKSFSDGTVLKYDKQAHALSVIGKMTVTISTTKDVTVTAKTATVNAQTTVNGETTINGKTTINGETTITGAVTVEGVVTATDVKAGVVSLLTHKHAGVKGGNEMTATPS